jgi:hypothetical protein
MALHTRGHRGGPRVEEDHMHAGLDSVMHRRKVAASSRRSARACCGVQPARGGTRSATERGRRAPAPARGQRAGGQPAAVNEDRSSSPTSRSPWRTATTRRCSRRPRRPPRAGNAKLTSSTATSTRHAGPAAAGRVASGKYDGIILQPVYGAGLVPGAEQAIAAGIPIGNIDQILVPTTRPPIPRSRPADQRRLRPE